MPIITPFFIWLAMVILFLLIEMVTVSLVSIWFVGGAVVALFSSLLGMPVPGQIVLFFLVSLGLLIATRPFVKKYVKPHNIRTNYEQVIGGRVQVTERIDNSAETGTVVYNGQEWSARSIEDTVVFEAGETATVQEVRGVKLYVKKG